ncbi:Protein SPT2 [Homalodisca vitripennis]|nr:Protein SPT2 [Homalodisca vitripennis]
MDFGKLLYTAHKNEKSANKDIKCYKTKFEPPKKEVKTKTDLSANIKKFMQKREEEDRKKAEEEKKKKEELLALRSQDKKAYKRVQTMLKRTKSANKSVMEDAIDDVNTVVTMAGSLQLLRLKRDFTSTDELPRRMHSVLKKSLSFAESEKVERGAATAGGEVGGGCRDVAVLIRPDTATAPAPRCNLQGLAVLALNMCYIGALSFTRCCTCRSDLIEVDPHCCAVATCPNNSKKTKGSEQRVVYYKFPKDSETCKIWLSKCKRRDAVNCKYAYVCSDHFAPSDYIDDMKNRLLGLPQKLLLKPFVVPSIKLPTISNDDDDVKTQLND